MTTYSATAWWVNISSWDAWNCLQILYRCENFVYYCEIHHLYYNATECCNNIFESKPFFSISGICYTTKLAINEQYPSSYSNIKFYFRLDREAAFSKFLFISIRHHSGNNQLLKISSSSENVFHRLFIFLLKTNHLKITKKNQLEINSQLIKTKLSEFPLFLIGPDAIMFDSIHYALTYSDAPQIEIVNRPKLLSQGKSALMALRVKEVNSVSWKCIREVTNEIRLQVW